MNGPSRSKDLPSSPWADRFPAPRCIFISENTNHSFLAPEFPRIDDPKYYDREPLSSDKPPQNNADIDKIMFTEKIQRKELFNLQTWQAASLNRSIRFSPSTGFISGGHRPADGRKTEFSFVFSFPNPAVYTPNVPFAGFRAWPGNLESNEEAHLRIYQRERINVDEKKWFPFLRKDRWFDWIHVTPEYDRPPGRTWSVDDPNIWENLSVSLELLQTMLYGRMDYWDNHTDHFGNPPSPDASVLLSLATEQMMSRNRGEPTCRWDEILTRTSEHWGHRLVHLLSSLIWSFQDIGSVEGFTQSRPFLNGRQWPYNSIIIINTQDLEVMEKTNLALEERCKLQVNCAIIILHELMHALLEGRYLNDDYGGNMLDHNRSGEFEFDEPYLNGDGIAEAGHYAEHLFFGGCNTPYPRDRYLPIASVIMEWPWPWYDGESAPNSAFLQDGNINRAYHVPAAWFCKIMAESFWRDPTFTRKSDNFFHRNAIFVMEYETRSGYRCKPKGPTVQDLRLLPYKYPEDERVVEDWNERNRIWENHRASWYPRASNEWEVTLWSDLNSRRQIARFADAFSKKDLTKCLLAATEMTSRVRDSRRSTFMRDMPVQYKESCLWVWYLIGLLMMASIPINYMNLKRESASKFEWTTEIAPSREAAAAGHANMVHIVPDNVDEEDEVKIRHRKFFNQIKQPDTEIHMHTQLDYLELIDDVINLITTINGVVEAKFLDAITAAAKDLDADRQNIVENYRVGHASRWASGWFFKYPVHAVATIPRPAHIVMNAVFQVLPRRALILHSSERVNTDRKHLSHHLRSQNFQCERDLASSLRMGHHNRHFAGDRHALSGAWSPPTSSANFCEEDYDVTRYFAEFVNTLTNLLYGTVAQSAPMTIDMSGFIPNLHENQLVFFALQYMYGPGSRGVLSPKVDFMSISLLVLGIASFLFHASLRQALQFGDELAMLGLVWSFLQGLLTIRRSSIYNQFINISLATVFPLFAVFYVWTGKIIYHVIGFSIALAFIIFRGVYLFYWRKPGFPHAKVAEWRIRGRVALVLMGIAYILWNIDLEFCAELRKLRHDLGLPLAWLLELHGWWHILTAMSAARFMEVVREVQQQLKEEKEE
ncbi:ceramidase-domain-containing protein [Xylaria sp. FL1777]|nr:ceramidase-domain-containing protein [Xylaria sp. FL1777]